MNLTTNIDELLYLRKEARENKNWKLADEIRNYLDTQNVFVFDHPGNNQEIFHLTNSYFDHIYNYDGWSESKMQKIERLYNIKFKNKRHFVEWNIQQGKLSERRFESWLYSTQKSIGRSIEKPFDNLFI